MRMKLNPLMLAAALVLLASAARAQDPVTGAFEGIVRDRQTNAPIGGASVDFKNKETGRPYPAKTNPRGIFFSGVLPPGTYTIYVSAPGYQAAPPRTLRNSITRNTAVIPRPVMLDSESGRSRPAPTPDAVTSGEADDGALVFYLVPASAQRPPPPAGRWPP